MPESHDHSPKKSIAPTSARSQGDVGDTSNGDEDAPASGAPKKSPLPIVLGIVAAVFFISSVVFWSRVTARDVTIEQNKNRAAQLQDGAVLLQAQLDETKANLLRTQTLMDEAKADSVRNKADLEVAKVTAADTQILLDKARLISADFQQQVLVYLSLAETNLMKLPM